MPRMITPIILVHHNHHHHHHDHHHRHHALLLVHQDGITSYLQIAGRQVSTAGQWIWIEEEMFVFSGKKKRKGVLKEGIRVLMMAIKMEVVTMPLSVSFLQIRDCRGPLRLARPSSQLLPGEPRLLQHFGEETEFQSGYESRSWTQ